MPLPLLKTYEAAATNGMPDLLQNDFLLFFPMKKKLPFILILFSLLAIAAALWQAYEAATLDSELRRIDERTQAQRLVQLSLPRVQGEMMRLIREERNKLGIAPDVGSPQYPMPEGGKADFNVGFFLLTPAGLKVPEGEENFAAALQKAPAIYDTIRRKADSPASPIYDPANHAKYDPKTHHAAFSVFQVTDTDFSKPMEVKGDAGPFFSWHYGDNFVYMRSVPTTHGNAAEGFIIDAEKLAAHLLPLVEPGLGNPQIRLVHHKEAANLAPLPLILLPGDKVELPDTRERAQALRGTVVSAWLIAASSVAVIFGLLAFYARMERRRSDFVSAVTHELRTPLTTFNLYTEMLHEGRVPQEKIPEYHETLLRESRRLAHLVENVLALAHLSRGKVRGRQDVGSCAELLPPLFSKVSDKLKQAGFSVHTTLDQRCKLMSLRTDLLSVEQILTNLADNAIKYAGGEGATVSISVIVMHRMLAIRFADHGKGMEEEAKKTIFRPFSRSASASRGGKPGVGLGLALSRDLARSIGGELAMEHSSEKGTTFLLTLPLGE